MHLSALTLMAGQAAEAMRHGGDPATWPAVGLAAVAAGGSWLSIFYTNRRAKRNGVKPGESLTCRKHGEDLASLIEFKDMTKESIREMKDDIRQIRDAVVK
jgi:hypothetical protein